VCVNLDAYQRTATKKQGYVFDAYAVLQEVSGNGMTQNMEVQAFALYASL
jgi:hypothetical protein